MTMTEWADELDLPYKTIQQRVFHGWDPVEALTKPIKQGSNHLKLEYVITSPVGDTYTVSNLAKFSREYGVSISSLEKMARGEILKTRDGWVCRRAHETEEERQAYFDTRKAMLTSLAQNRHNIDFNA